MVTIRRRDGAVRIGGRVVGYATEGVIDFDGSVSVSGCWYLRDVTRRVVPGSWPSKRALLEYVALLHASFGIPEGPNEKIV